MGRHSIRVRSDAGWDELGKERYPNAEPSPPQVQSDPGGFAGCSFTLPAADPGLPNPALAANAECEIDFDGVRIFEGRIGEAPVSGAERTVSVQGRGWQYALDENPVAGDWLAVGAGGWVDSRELVGAPIWNSAGVAVNGFSGGGTVNIADGQIMLGHGSGIAWPPGACVGVTRDFGPDGDHWPEAVTFLMTIPATSAPANVRLLVVTHDRVGEHFAAVQPFLTNVGLPSQPVWTTAPKSQRHVALWLPAATTQCRYVTIMVRYGGVAAYTPTVDDICTIADLKVFRRNRYRRSGSSALRVSRVLEDVFARTPGLKDPTVAPEKFAGEASSLPVGWWLRGSANADATGRYAHTTTGAPTFANTPGPLAQAEPSSFAAFAGGTDGLSFDPSAPGGVAGYFPSLTDFTLFILFRTTQTPPVGTAWPNGRGLLDARVGGGVVDWGLELVSGGKVSGGIANADLSTQAATPSKVVNDGAWHTAVYRREMYKGGPGGALTRSVITVVVDGDVAAAVAADQSGNSGGLVAAATPLYVGCNQAGNNMQVDVGEALFVHGALSDTDIEMLHRAALAPGTGTIKRTLLDLPGYATGYAAKTARGHADDLNLYHRYQIKVGRDRTPWFWPPPTVPKYALVDDAVERFQDTSTSAGADTYNRALILGTRPDGRAVSEYRYAAGLAGARTARLAAAFTNPGAEVNASGWTNEILSGPGLVRVTSGQFSGAGGFRLNTTGAGGADYWRGWQPFGVALTQDVVYVASLWVRSLGGALDADNFVSIWDVTNSLDVVRVTFDDELYALAGALSPSIAYRQVLIPFAVNRNAGANEFALRIQATGVDLYFDDLTLSRSQHHRLDRLGQLRTRTIEFGENIDVPTSRALADAFLTTKLRTPFAGSLPIGPGDLVTYGAAPVAVPPAVLCDNVGELVHFPGLFDPDGSGPGRDGQIVSVAFSCETEQAEVSFDNTRDNFEALMARGALLRGGT